MGCLYSVIFSFTISGLLRQVRTPNASLQLLPEAGAKRRLEAVSCKVLFGSYTAAAAVQRGLLDPPVVQAD